MDMANADLGDKPIAEITASLILQTLKKIENKGNYETAIRLQSTIDAVSRFAVATT